MIDDDDYARCLKVLRALRHDPDGLRGEAAAQVVDEAAAPMRGPSAYSIPLGFLILWMGPASMLEHGTLTTTWGWFDAASIHWFALLISGYLIQRTLPERVRPRPP